MITAGVILFVGGVLCLILIVQLCADAPRCRVCRSRKINSVMIAGVPGCRCSRCGWVSFEFE